MRSTALGTTARRASSPGARDWPAYAAASWAGVFAVRAVYWALGGTVGLGTLSEGIRERAADGDVTVFAALWIVAMLLGAGAALALALARSWSLRVPHRVPLVGGWAPPAWMLLVATAGAGGLLVMHGAGYISLLATADASTVEVRWYGLLWGPWFLFGGILYLLTAHRFAYRSLAGADDPLEREVGGGRGDKRHDEVLTRRTTTSGAPPAS